MGQATGGSINGVLNLIDLAGSDRLSRSAATGDRLKETQVGAMDEEVGVQNGVKWGLGNVTVILVKVSPSCKYWTPGLASVKSD